MRRKFLATALAFCAVAGTVVFSLISPAVAQTGSGIGQCTPVTGTQNVGTVAVGQQFVLQIAPTCLYNAGAPVTVNANGVSFADVVESNGTVLVNVNVLSTTQLSINPVVPAICGVNTITVTGPSSSALGGTATQSATFTLNCAAAPVVATAIQGRLSLTGANTARYAALALALMVAGSAFVVFTRRRRADSTVG